MVVDPDDVQYFEDVLRGILLDARKRGLVFDVQLIPRPGTPLAMGNHQYQINHRPVREPS